MWLLENDGDVFHGTIALLLETVIARPRELIKYQGRGCGCGQERDLSLVEHLRKVFPPLSERLYLADGKLSWWICDR
jgi:hypothetical protein